MVNVASIGVPHESTAGDTIQECCGNCAAFYPIQKLGTKVGQCRRSPPTPMITAFVIEQMPDGKTLMIPARGIDGVWPLTGTELHCFEYRRKSLNGLLPISVPILGEVVSLGRDDLRQKDD